jgi:hypothetical protein
VFLKFDWGKKQFVEISLVFNLSRSAAFYDSRSSWWSEGQRFGGIARAKTETKLDLSDWKFEMKCRRSWRTRELERTELEGENAKAFFPLTFTV